MVKPERRTKADLLAAAAIVTVVAGCGAAYGIDSFLQAAHLIQGG